MSKFIVMWTLSSAITWTIGFAGGLYLGFLFPIVGDVFATLLFAFAVLFFQYVLLTDYSWRKQYVTNTILGLFLGVLIAFIFVLVSDKFLGLGLSHILAFPVSLAVISYFQSRAIGSKRWILVNLLSFSLAAGVLFLIHSFFELNLIVLDVRIREYSAIPSWGLIGFIIGIFYGLLSSFFLTATSEG